MDLEKLTIKEAKEKLKEVTQLHALFNTKESETCSAENEEVNHGWSIVILDKGFMYIGELITDGEWLTINDPSNIRYYESGKGLLWHAKNGPEKMTLDKYEGGQIKAPYSELKHFIPTNKGIWK